jgi:cobalt-zinc-cadmium efflux system outer membrane protein
MAFGDLHDPRAPLAVRARWRTLLFVLGASLASASFAQELTLGEALRRAEEANARLRSALAERSALEGQLADARALLWNNPTVAGEFGRRTIPNEARQREYLVGISQPFEIAGQRGYRREEAERLLAAYGEQILDLRRQVRAEVSRRFFTALALQARIETERAVVKLTEDSAAIVDKRFRAGEDTRLQANVAEVEADRARNEVRLLEEQLVQARAELASLLQLAPAELPAVRGDLGAASPGYGLEELLRLVDARPQFRALGHIEEAARNRLALERASVYPDVTLGVGTGREGGSDARENLTLFTVSVPLPLFRRNAAGIGRASADLTRTQIEREATLRDARGQVIALWRNFESLRARVTRLRDAVLPRLNENQQLSQRALRAGEIGIAELLLVNRQLLDAQRDYFAALAEHETTRITLEEAAGWPAEPRPATNSGAKP